MTRPQTIQAQVNPRLLGKAQRLFTGTLKGRIIEVLQNARRAGATRVEIVNNDGHVTVKDNGGGIADFRGLLDLGGSGWADGDRLETSEDPAGVGLFCLAPRKVTIRSNGKRIEIENDGWTGAPVPVEADTTPANPGGASLVFEDEPWTKQAVEPLAVFTGMRVTVDGEACDSESFITESDVHDPGLGCRLRVIPHNRLSKWQRHAAHAGCVGENNVVINFHGQTVGFTERPIDEHLYYFIDLTGEPTGVRLMLPARTQLVENDALVQLKALIEREAYHYVQRRGHHRLPFSQYQRARELGIDLPESEPVYQVGLLTDDGYDVEAVPVQMPEGFDLSRCYRYDDQQDDAMEANTHLLAALGMQNKPFVPVSIRSAYDGYAWADLPTVTGVSVKPGSELVRDWASNGEAVVVSALSVEARTSDGRVFRSDVCMAVASPDTVNDAPSYGYDAVYLTPDARHRLRDTEIWHHLGGYNDEGDTWDTQEFEFSRRLDAIWARLDGPDEPLRRKLYEAADHIRDDWMTVTLHRDGRMTITNQDGATRKIAPPQPDGDHYD